MVLDPQRRTLGRPTGQLRALGRPHLAPRTGASPAQPPPAKAQGRRQGLWSIFSHVSTWMEFSLFLPVPANGVDLCVLVKDRTALL